MKDRIHYDLVGSIPEMDQHDDQFEHLMDQALAGDKVAERLVIDGAAHFYGLSIGDFAGVAGLIDAIKSLEEEAKFA
jgi:hypothetical protein